MILDVNCFIGHWPFRRIPYRTVGDIKGLMARANIQGALVTPLAGLFFKDCLSAVREMLDELEAEPSPNLWPVAVVNPTFPGWQDDLKTMVDEWGCVAVRLFPNYHRYRLPDPQAADLLKVAMGRGIPLMISVRIEDERLQHWLVRIDPVPRLDLMWVLRAFPDLKLVLLELKPDEMDQLHDNIVTHSCASLDIAERRPQFHLEEMVEQLGSHRVMFGTGMPLKYPECSLHQVRDARLSGDAKQRILYRNASEMFGVRIERGEQQDDH